MQIINDKKNKIITVIKTKKEKQETRERNEIRLNKLSNLVLDISIEIEKALYIDIPATEKENRLNKIVAMIQDNKEYI